jgi:hypothetical protein
MVIMSLERLIICSCCKGRCWHHRHLFITYQVRQAPRDSIIMNVNQKTNRVMVQFDDLAHGEISTSFPLSPYLIEYRLTAW